MCVCTCGGGVFPYMWVSTSLCCKWMVKGPWLCALVLALAVDSSVWAAMFSSDLPPLFHQENHREQGRGRRSGLKAGSNTMALRCYLCPSPCWRECGSDAAKKRESERQRGRKGLWEWFQCSPLLLFSLPVWGSMVSRWSCYQQNGNERCKICSC